MMEKLEDTSYDSYSLAKRFWCDLCEELGYHRSSRRYLTREEYMKLKTYYHYLNYRTVKYIAHYEASLLKRMISCIFSYTKPPRILDAGCGLGSEAIFFSLLGADVVGVDLNRERLDTANKRVKYYQEKYNKTLNVKFHLKNILKFCEHSKFDMVWSNQSISHIHPIHDFLKVAWKNLKNGGYLIVSDSNNINPYVIFRAWLVHRKGGLYTVVKDPTSFKLVPYARERLLNPVCLNSLLRKTHFNIKLVEYHGFVPPQFNTKRFFRFMDRTLTKPPFIRLMGARYIISARKSDVASA